jgi:hypothetical protein
MPIVQLGNAAHQFQQSAAARRRDTLPPRVRSQAELAAAPAAPASQLEAPRAGFFYPRIIYGGGSQLDFTTPANPLPSEGAVKGENISLNGFQETLFVRDEDRLTLGFTILHRDNLMQIRAWWKDWAKLGRQSAIILDRFDTCTTQYEYMLFNTYFDKAHCLYNPFEPKRFIVSQQLFVLQLVFRQGRSGN